MRAKLRHLFPPPSPSGGGNGGNGPDDDAEEYRYVDIQMQVICFISV